MQELEQRLRERETADLQRALHRNELVPEAASMARLVLTERGASIPEAMSDEQTESEYKGLLRSSNTKFWLVVVTIVGWFAYAELFDLFASGNGERLSRSVFVTGLSLAVGLGLIKFRR